MSYDKEMDELIKKLDYVPKLLLHSCCAPCSSAVIERLSNFFDITVFYYNPNIEGKDEYEKRKEEQINYLKKVKSPNKIDFLEGVYDNDIWKTKIKGLEKDKERGKRCYICYKKRLEETKKVAEENNFDYFGTTLTLSPYKVTSWINEIGLSLENDKVKFLVSDFKKKDGYKRSIELSKKYNLYRQNYCGCVYSRRTE